MTELLRIGDITGYDDADVIDMGEDIYLVIDTQEETSNEDKQQDV